MTLNLRKDSFSVLEKVAFWRGQQYLYIECVHLRLQQQRRQSLCNTDKFGKSHLYNKAFHSHHLTVPLNI